MKFFTAGPISRIHNPMCPNWALGVVYARGSSSPMSYETLLWLHEEISVLSNLKFAIDEIKQIPSFTGLTNFT